MESYPFPLPPENPHPLPLLDYPILEHKLANIRHLHETLRVETQAWRTPLHHVLHFFKTLLTRMPPYGVPALLTQLRKEAHHFAELNERTLHAGHALLDAYHDYSRTLRDSATLTSTARANTATRIRELEAALYDEQRALRQTPRTSHDYYPAAENVRDQTRQLADTRNHHTLAELLIIDINEEHYFADRKEELLRHSIYTARILHAKAQALETHITTTSFFYQASLYKHKCSTALCAAIGRQEALITQLKGVTCRSQDQTRHLAMGKYTGDATDEFLGTTNQETIITDPIENENAPPYH